MNMAIVVTAGLAVLCALLRAARVESQRIDLGWLAAAFFLAAVGLLPAMSWVR